MKLPTIRSNQDFKRYYLLYCNNLERQQFKDILGLASVFGKSSFRKSNSFLTKQFLQNSFHSIQEKPEYEKFSENIDIIAQLVIQCGNNNLYIKQLYDDFSQNIEGHINIQTLVPVYWAFKNVKCDSNDVQNKIFKIIMQNVKSFNETQILILLWIISYENKIDYEFVNVLIDLYQNTTFITHQKLDNKKQGIFCQIMINLYPQKQNDMFQFEDFQQMNPKIQLKKRFYEQFFISRFLFNKNRYEYIINVAQNDYYSIIKPAQKKSNVFENNVEECLKILKFDYKKNIIYGIYEIDFFIQNKALEVNGDQHFIFDGERSTFQYNQIYENKIKQLYLKKATKDSWTE